MMKSKVKEMNSAGDSVPKSGHRAPAGKKGMGSPVGNETKAAVKATQDGGSFAEAKGNPLKGAKSEMSREYAGKRSR